MSVGALLGSVLGRFWSYLWPSAADASYPALGAGALLAAAMQGPLAATVLMLELARQTGALLVPMLIAAVGATVTVRALRSDSIYSARVRLCVTLRTERHQGPPRTGFSQTRHLRPPSADVVSQLRLTQR